MPFTFHRYDSNIEPNYTKEQVDFTATIIAKSLPCQEIWLYGSQAYGEPHFHSDVDLYIVIKSMDCEKAELLRKIWTIIYEARLQYPNRICECLDISAGSFDEFYDKIQGFTLERTVYESGIKVYAGF